MSAPVWASVPSASVETDASSAPAARPDRRRRAWPWWIGIGAALAIIALLGTWLGSAQSSSTETLDPDGRGMYGARALAEILRDGGVDVIVTRSHTEAQRLLTDTPQSTLVTTGATYISDDTWESLFTAAHDVVLLDRDLSRAVHQQRARGTGVRSSRSRTSRFYPAGADARVAERDRVLSDG